MKWVFTPTVLYHKGLHTHSPFLHDLISWVLHRTSCKFMVMNLWTRSFARTYAFNKSFLQNQVLEISMVTGKISTQNLKSLSVLLFPIFRLPVTFRHWTCTMDGLCCYGCLLGVCDLSFVAAAPMEATNGSLFGLPRVCSSSDELRFGQQKGNSDSVDDRKTRTFTFHKMLSD